MVHIPLAIDYGISQLLIQSYVYGTVHHLYS